MNKQKIAFTKMCEVIGINYDDVDFTNPQWFLTHSWTKEQEDKFEKWLVTLIMKNTMYTEHYAKVQAGFFILNYGWKTKEE